MTSSSPAHGLIGELIDDRYRILAPIGRGGMGAVYQAEAVRLGRRCAVKVLLPEFTKHRTAVQRFRQEALIAARVKHPHVVEIFDTGTTAGGLGYIAMELLQGESLHTTLRREGRIAWPRARHIARQICDALAFAHANGVIHRDMKPENCFRIARSGDDDYIKLLDFGIAKLVDSGNGEAQRLTVESSVLGTYSYMSPEQVRGLEPDHRVDVWAIGVILYEMLTGTLPFRGQNPNQIAIAIHEEAPMPMCHLVPEAGIPRAVEVLVARALEKSRDLRYPTADALLAALLAVDDAGVASSPLTPMPAVGGPPSTSIDVQAATIAAAIRVTGPPPVGPEFGRERADTHPHADVPPADARGRTEVAPIADVVASAPVAGSRSLSVPGPRSRWLAVGGLVGLAVVLLVKLRGFGDPSAEEPTAPLPSAAPALAVGLHPAPPKPPPPIPVEPDLAVLPDATAPPPAPPLPDPVEPDLIVLVDDPPLPPDPRTTPKPKSRPKNAAPKPTLANQVSRKLGPLCDGAGIRDCFVAAKLADKQISVKIIVPSTGKARVEFPPLWRGTKVARCVEREVVWWKLPTGDPGEPDTVHPCTLNR